ncbi:hypothetical protein BC832DRAFT_363885 [Gaertneriomyces semiglobifer]|nr:hypothetical protein BC832DRAFT_363885 [Gaertneriomyces semiglobifer]
MSTLLVQNQILVSRQLFDVCIKETNESNKLKLSVLWAICLLHEIAHVLMFRFGYGGRLHPISNQPFKTPGGVLLGEAGFFVEMTLITGLIHWSHRGKQFDGVFLRLDDGRSLRCPIAWLQRFVDRETYTNATETTFRFDPGQSSPLRGSRYRRTTHDLHVAEIFERSPEPRSFAVSVESFGPDEAWSEEEHLAYS